MPIGKYAAVIEACAALALDDYFSVKFETPELRARASLGIRSAICQEWPGGKKAERRFTMTQGDVASSVHIWIKRIK